MPDGQDVESRVIDFATDSGPMTVRTGTGKSIDLDMDGARGRLLSRVHSVEVRWPGASCRITLVIPELEGGMPGTIGPLTCAAVAP